MVWFVCDDCGDSIKKPKVPQHLQQCSASRFTCLDCSRSFDRHTVKGHATCVTEVDKYAKGATKPGGYAAQGYYKDGSVCAKLTARAKIPCWDMQVVSSIAVGRELQQRTTKGSSQFVIQGKMVSLGSSASS
ncbi:hypothetical protein WJX79_010919 [Trebouxia sp. C0005]